MIKCDKKVGAWELILKLVNEIGIVFTLGNKV